MSESKPITISTFEYVDYQRYGAIEQDNGFYTVSIENKADLSSQTFVNLDNTKVKVMMDAGAAINVHDE